VTVSADAFNALNANTSLSKIGQIHIHPVRRHDAHRQSQSVPLRSEIRLLTPFPLFLNPFRIRPEGFFLEDVSCPRTSN